MGHLGIAMGHRWDTIGTFGKDQEIEKLGEEGLWGGEIWGVRL